MIQNITLITLITVRLFSQSIDNKEIIVPFASPAPTSTTTIEPAKVISINGKINDGKILLNWVVSQNENAAQFEVEKSLDGKNFTMAALVFGTDKTATDNYLFYEKSGKKKTLYRIKIINKDQTVDYSSIIQIDPKA